MNCESCEAVGIKVKADTIVNGEHVCSDCAADIREREAEQKRIREVGYDARGIRMP